MTEETKHGHFQRATHLRAEASVRFVPKKYFAAMNWESKNGMLKEHEVIKIFTEGLGKLQQDAELWWQELVRGCGKMKGEVSIEISLDEYVDWWMQSPEAKAQLERVLTEAESIHKKVCKSLPLSKWPMSWWPPVNPSDAVTCLQRACGSSPLSDRDGCTELGAPLRILCISSMIDDVAGLCAATRPNVTVLLVDYQNDTLDLMSVLIQQKIDFFRHAEGSGASNCLCTCIA